MSDFNSKNIIFLISQPRSGSSMLQQILLNNSKICSTPETWLMLQLISVYKETNITDSYNPKYATVNLNHFLNSIEGSHSILETHLKKIAFDLYGSQCSKGTFFLDKTPRYYHIIEDLYKLFPDSKFIFLFRNPISVFSSMLEYNFNGKLTHFLSAKDRYEDLIMAPYNIIQAIKKETNFITIKYENIVSNSNSEISKIFNYLEIPISKNISTYSVDKNYLNTNSVDKKSVHLHNKPSSKYLDTWKKVLNDSQKKKACLGYLNNLEKKLNGNYFDYNFEKMKKDLINHTPLRKTYFNLDFKTLTSNDSTMKTIPLLKKRFFLRIQNSKHD